MESAKREKLNNFYIVLTVFVIHSTLMMEVLYTNKGVYFVYISMVTRAAYTLIKFTWYTLIV